jgi:hypothetical protein
MGQKVRRDESALTQKQKKGEKLEFAPWEQRDVSLWRKFEKWNHSQHTSRLVNSTCTTFDCALACLFATHPDLLLITYRFHSAPIKKLSI